MDEREVRFFALDIASRLPTDRDDAHRVLELARDLIDNFIHGEQNRRTISDDDRADGEERI
jgi:hypothetical protein